MLGDRRQICVGGSPGPASARLEGRAAYTDGMELDTIYCIDNVEGCKKHLPDESVDLVVTSPPYGKLRTYGTKDGPAWDFDAIADQLVRVLKPGGVIVWVVADETVNGSETGESFRQGLGWLARELNLLDTMIWNKPPQGACGNNNAYPQAFEYMFVATKGKPITCCRLADRHNTSWGSTYDRTRGGRNTKHGGMKTGETRLCPEFGVRTNVWNVIKESAGNPHPAPFPEALARDHILSWSAQGDIVLDPFMGSGTTAKAAAMLNRKYIGFEINAEYVEDARRRLGQAYLWKT